MRARTFTLLGTAAICATVAVILTQNMISGRSDKVQVIERRVIPKTQSVVVATRNLPFGTKFKPDMLKVVKWPQRLAPTGVFGNIADLVSKRGGRVVLSAISKGEPILTAKVSKPGQKPSLSSAIGQSKLAVTIRVDDVHGVAGFVQPDDRVDVLLTRRSYKGQAGEVQPKQVFTDVLLQNIRVLAVGQKLDRTTKAKSVRTVTVEVDRVRAQKLVLSASVGVLSLALRNTTSIEVGESRRVSLSDLPSPPGGAPVAIKDEVKPHHPVVTIVRGTSDRKQYEVRPDVPGTEPTEPLESTDKPKPPAKMSDNQSLPSATAGDPSGRDWLLTRPVAIVPAAPEAQKEGAASPIPKFVPLPQ